MEGSVNQLVIVQIPRDVGIMSTNALHLKLRLFRENVRPEHVKSFYSVGEYFTYILCLFYPLFVV